MICDDLVRRDWLPFISEPVVPAVLRVEPVGGLDLELGLHRIAGIAARLGMLVAPWILVVVRSLQAFEEFLIWPVWPFALRPRTVIQRWIGIVEYLASICEWDGGNGEERGRHAEHFPHVYVFQKAPGETACCFLSHICDVHIPQLGAAIRCIFWRYATAKERHELILQF